MITLAASAHVKDIRIDLRQSEEELAFGPVFDAQSSKMTRGFCRKNCLETRKADEDPGELGVNEGRAIILQSGQQYRR
jgi:hypothetical protein